MEKINEKTNVINWFEIPVLDSERAKRFYETIFDIEMHTAMMVITDFIHAGDMNEEMTFFPSVQGVIQATSGRVTGALVKSDRFKPSNEGVLIYFNAYPTIQTIIDKIEPAGGKIIVPKYKNLAGYIAIFMDSEGNKVGLHAEA
jgi:hypothetical protein